MILKSKDKYNSSPGTGDEKQVPGFKGGESSIIQSKCVHPGREPTLSLDDGTSD